MTWDSGHRIFWLCGYSQFGTMLELMSWGTQQNSRSIDEFFSCSPTLTTLTHRAFFRNCYSSYFFLFDLYREHCLWDSWVCGRKSLESEIKRSAVWSWKARKLPEHPESTFLMCKIKTWCACLLEADSRLNENIICENPLWTSFPSVPFLFI